MVGIESEIHSNGVVNQERYAEVFDRQKSKFPGALHDAVDRFYPDGEAWKKIQTSLAYTIKDYDPDTRQTGPSTTPAKQDKRIERMAADDSDSPYDVRLLHKLFNSTRKTYFRLQDGGIPPTQDPVGKLLVDAKQAINRLDPDAQPAHREIFREVFVNGYFRGLGYR